MRCIVQLVVVHALGCLVQAGLKHVWHIGALYLQSVSHQSMAGSASMCMQLCLELVLAIALRNRERVMLVWPLVHDYLALILSAEGAKPGNSLVRSS